MLPFAPDLPLETERLRLRRFTHGDVGAVADIHGRDDVVRWLPEGVWARPRAEEVVARWVDRRQIGEDDTAIIVAVEERATGAFAGHAMLRLVSAQHLDGEIGYVIHPDMQGRGYATELGRELLRLAFDGAGLHRVVARCEVRNVASYRVMERLGMRREAHHVESEWIQGEWQSEFVYALLEREWRSAAT